MNVSDIECSNICSSDNNCIVNDAHTYVATYIRMYYTHSQYTIVHVATVGPE